MSFKPSAKETYTLQQILDNGLDHMKAGDVAPPGAIEVTTHTIEGLLKHYGRDVQLPGAVNDLIGRSLVHMVGAVGTINRIIELMDVHKGEVLKVYHQLEEEGLLLASPALYDEK